MVNSHGLSVCLRVMVVWGAVFAGCPEARSEHEFRRGDANLDGRVDVGDALDVISFLFLGTPQILCFDAADTDDVGKVDITDGLNIILAGVTGAVTIPAPGPLVCGPDPTDVDGLDCGSYPHEICDSPPAVPSVDTFELSLGAAARFDGAPGDRFPVTVALCHEFPVGAISVPLSVSGCRVVRATVSLEMGVSEIAFDDDKVLFSWFFVGAELSENSVAGACDLPRELFTFEVEIDPGRGSCTFVFVDELAGSGLPLANRVVSSTLGGSARPAARSLAVPYCITSSAACPPRLGLEVETTLPVVDGSLFATAGQSIGLDTFVTVDNVDPALVEAWSLSIGGLGSEIDFVDAVCQLPCLETLIGSGADLTFSRDERVDPTVKGQGPGFVSSGVLNAATPLGAGRFRIGHFRASLTVPHSGSGPTSLHLFFKDGLEGASGIPSVNNVSLATGETFEIADGVGISDLSLEVVPVQDLSLGVITDAFVNVTVPESYLRLPSPTAGTALRMTVTDAEARDRQAVYLRWGAPPTTLVHDQVVFEDDSNQIMVIPEASGRDAYFLIEGREYDGRVNSLSVIVEEIDFEITSMSGSFSGPADSATVSVRVDGVGFTEGTVFSLHSAGGVAPLVARDAVLVSSRRADVVFDIDSTTPPDVYDLHADDVVIGLSAVFRGGFEILPPPALGPVTELDVRGGRVYRFNWVYIMTLVVRNLGEIERPAPLLRVRGILDPEEPCVGCIPNTLTTVFTQMQVPGESTFHVDRDLFVLAADREGFTGYLAPGAEVEIPVTYQTTHCRSCPGRFEVALFTPRAFDFIGWDVMAPPAGIDPSVWDEVWPGLSATLGGSWLDLNNSLADLAARLSPRHFPITSVHDLVRFATREALGRESTAIVGTVKDSMTRLPVAGVEIFALIENVVQSSAVTDSDGRFTIDWLRGSSNYTMVVEGHSIVAPSSDMVRFDLGVADIFGREFIVEPGVPSGLVANCVACDESDLPVEPLAFPDGLFTPHRNFDIDIISSYDPNDKEGPEGDEDDLTNAVGYTIYFQNDPEKASAPVRTARIVELLDGNLFDLDSFVPGPVSVGGHVFPPLVDTFSSSNSSPGASSYQLDVTDTIVIRDTGDCVGIDNCGDGCTVDCNGPVERTENVKVTFSWYRDTGAVIDPGACNLGTASDMDGLAVWEFTTIGGEPTGGFLPPDDCCGQGTGSVGFSVNLMDNAHNTLVAGDPVENDACIFFDPEGAVASADLFNLGCSTDHEILVTPTAEPGAPINISPVDASTLEPLPVMLDWRGEADSYDVYVWTGTEFDPPGAPLSTDNTFFYLTPLDLDPGVQYFWKVVAFDEENNTTDGEVWSFDTLAEGAVPLIPTNPMPVDGAVELTRMLNFSWDAPGATAYCVRVWTEGTNAVVGTFDANGIVNNLLENVELDAGTQYLWEVTAMNDAGSVTGSEWTFNTATLVFERGNIDESSELDLSDVINSLLFQFLGQFAPRCMKAGDVDDSGLVDVTDPILLLQHLFLGTYDIPAPFDECGEDPIPDGLNCAAFDLCE
jgi:hypothetical protein